MKKIALTSLIAMFAVAGAHAANVIDGNPLYMPKAGHFYSVTALESHTKAADAVALGEEFGYGIMDNWSIEVNTSLAQEDWFNKAEWESLGLATAFRVIDDSNWKLDLLGGYEVGPVLDAHDGFFKGRFLNKEDTLYAWTAGLRGGYTEGDFTIAGHINMIYENTKSFNWKHEVWAPAEDEFAGLHLLNAGIDAQLVLNNHWNLVAGADYMKLLDHYSETTGSWELTFGANYNIDATKYVGAYITKDVRHEKVASDGDWQFQDGFGMGVKFGIDF